MINPFVWSECNRFKVEAVEHMPEERWMEVKEACDDLMRSATGNPKAICPAWYIG